jgi:ketosteroid isomerase-like protein
MPPGGRMGKTTGAILSDFYDAWRAQELDWLASYLPDDFCHTMVFPVEIHPLAGTARGKRAVMERWRLYTASYEFLHFDTGCLIAERDRAAVEIPFHYRHIESGADLLTTKANFWTLVDGWPVQLTEYYDVENLLDHTRTVTSRLAGQS